VLSDIAGPRRLPQGEYDAAIILSDPYATGLQRIAEYSHLWVLTWLHLADRDSLVPGPRRANAFLPEYGVFALRSPGRPNPIALSSVALIAVEGAMLYVAGLDMLDRTPVLDLKPYNERDTIFSPRGPRFLPTDRQGRRSRLERMALTHHGEACPWLLRAVEIALVAEARLGPLEDDDVVVHVAGPGCLVDALQGITRARFAHPARLVYVPAEAGSGTPVEVEFHRGETTVRFGGRADEAASLTPGGLL
jgi:tRNA-Thr(GGU) m(6)t(6)A37 methyltransferase TsaA